MKKNKIYLLAMVMILFFSYLTIGTPRTAWSVDVKITELPADTDPTSDDLVMTVNDPEGSAANRKVTKANWQKILFNSGIASAIPGTCTEPQTYWATDTDVLYICTATNTWTIFSSGAPTDAHYLVDRAEGGLGAEINLGALTTGLLKITVGGGVATPSTAVSGTDYEAGGTAILKSVIAAAGDVLVGTGVATPGVITKGANNSIFGVDNSGTLGFFSSFSFGDTVTFFDTDSETRLFRFDGGGITAGNTRIMTFPDFNFTPAAILTGANPTLDNAGKIGVDTSATAGGGLRFYDTAERQLPAYQTKCVVIKDPTATSDYPVEWFPYAITLREARYLVIGGTNWIGQFNEGDANGLNGVDTQSADSTVTPGTVVVVTSFSNASIDANDWVLIKSTSISGTPTSLSACFSYTIDPVN